VLIAAAAAARTVVVEIGVVRSCIFHQRAVTQRYLSTVLQLTNNNKSSISC